MLPAVQRRKNGNDHIHTGNSIADGGTYPGRGCVRLAGEIHKAAYALGSYIVTRAIFVGTVGAVAGDGGIDKAGIDLLQNGIAHVKTVHDTGTEILHQYIRVPDQFLEKLFALGGFQVQSNALFIVVDSGKVGAGAVSVGGIAASYIRRAGIFNFDHIRAHGCHPHGGKWAGEHLGQINNFETRKGASKNFLLHQPSSLPTMVTLLTLFQGLPPRQCAIPSLGFSSCRLPALPWN